MIKSAWSRAGASFTNGRSGRESDGCERDQVDRNEPGRASCPGHEARRRKGGETAYSRADLEAERSAAVAQPRCGTTRFSVGLQGTRTHFLDLKMLSGLSRGVRNET